MEYTDAVPVAHTGGNSVMAVQHKAELEAMVDTAHKYPRSVKRFEEEALSMATCDQETASQMFYVLPRGGKTIEGFSTRLAEIVATAWGNLRYGARIVEVGETMITAQGFCFDCEKNTGTTLEVQRRITDKYGKRFNDDMIVVTGNAACSIALRNAIGKVVPRAYIEKVYRKAKEVAIGRAISLDQQRSQAFDYIKKMGVQEDRILAVIGRPSVKDVSVDDIIILRGLATSIKDGETTLDEAFPEIVAEDSADTTTTPAKGSPKGAAAKAKEKLKPVTEPEPETTPPEIPTRDSDAWGLAFTALDDAGQQKYNDAYDAALADGMDAADAHDNAYSIVMV